MNIAIPVWNGFVSSVFDITHYLLVVGLKDNHEIHRWQIQLEQQAIISDTRFGPMVHSKIGIAEENSRKLVSLISKEAKKITEGRKKDLIIVEESPVIRCPVMASITGTDLVLIITEPTLSGKHYLCRIADLAAGFGILTLAAINKFGLNADIAGQIVGDVRRRNIKTMGIIRYDNVFTKAKIMKCSIVEYTGGAVTEDIQALWRNVTYALRRAAAEKCWQSMNRLLKISNVSNIRY